MSTNGADDPNCFQLTSITVPCELSLSSKMAEAERLGQIGIWADLVRAIGSPSLLSFLRWFLAFMA